MSRIILCTMSIVKDDSLIITVKFFKLTDNTFRCDLLPIHGSEKDSIRVTHINTFFRKHFGTP